MRKLSMTNKKKFVMGLGFLGPCHCEPFFLKNGVAIYVDLGKFFWGLGFVVGFGFFVGFFVFDEQKQEN